MVHFVSSHWDADALNPSAMEPDLSLSQEAGSFNEPHRTLLGTIASILARFSTSYGCTLKRREYA